MKHVIILLWLVWLGLLPGTFIFVLLAGSSAASSMWWLSSVTLALSAWINWCMHRHDDWGLFAFFVALGMSLGMLADVYGSFEVVRFTEALPMIVLLFALGHTGYIIGVLKVAQKLRLTQHPHWTKTLSIATTIYCLAGIGVWMIVVKPSGASPNMHLPTAVYTVFLSLAGAAMAAVAVRDRRFFAIGLGGFLFVVSDMFLAVKLFQDNWRGIGDFCWITYGIGQMLIVYGAIIRTWGRTAAQRIAPS